MNVSQAKNLMLELTEEHFPNYCVIFDKQSRTAKPNIPLVTIAQGNVKRHRSENEFPTDSSVVGYYGSRIAFTIDLFTNGVPVFDDDNVEIGRDNTAVDEMLEFYNFINSQYVTLWSGDKDVALVIEGDVIDLTGIVNDTTYAFRSRMTVNFYFTQKTFGEKAAPTA